MLKSHIPQVIREIERRLSHGVLESITVGAESFRDKITAEQSPPTSDPGEYPHRDTGQAEANVTIGIERAADREVEGRYGYMGENSNVPQFEDQDHIGAEHLDELRQKGWKGLDHSAMEDLDKLRRAFKRGSRS